MTERTKPGISTVRFSELEGSWRMDAEYYQPHYLAAAEKLQRCGRVSEIIECALHPAEIKREYSKAGLQLLLAQNVRQNYLDFSIAVFMPETVADLLRKNRLHPGDVVMVRTGANAGDTACYDGEPERLYASAHLILIRPKVIEGAYLSTYFNTEIGRQLVRRGVYGSSQPEIAPAYVETLPVPRNDAVEREVVELVNQAREAQRESKRLYRQAEQLLLDELGLHYLKLPDGLHSQAALTQAWQAHRIDSEYFRPRCLGATEAIYHCGYPVYPLRELLSAPLANGATPLGADYAEGEVVFLTAENIKELQVWPDDKRIAAEFSNSVLARSRLKPGDLLITIKGKVGVAAVVPEFEGEWNINQDVARAQIDPSINPYYLAVFFESELGQAQVDRLTTGAINPFLGLGNLIDFPIPIPPRDVQDRFEGITRNIIEKRRQAEALLKQAKRKVEAMIESEVAHG